MEGGWNLWVWLVGKISISKRQLWPVGGVYEEKLMFLTNFEMIIIIKLTITVLS